MKESLCGSGRRSGDPSEADAPDVATGSLGRVSEVGGANCLRLLLPWVGENIPTITEDCEKPSVDSENSMFLFCSCAAARVCKSRWKKEKRVLLSGRHFPGCKDFVKDLVEGGLFANSVLLAILQNEPKR